MKQLLERAGYEYEPQTGVWAHPGFAGIAYSDGDEVEQRLAQLIAQATDLQVLSDELKQHITDWPSLYHLSSSRANILRPFAQRLSGMDVLEIGAGCGAITRYLGESGARVLALEGSARRAAIARSRTRDLEQVEVLAERFDQFSCSAQFDVVTLIGVLEYANQFVPSPSPALTMLQRARALLKPGGLLLVAIENQLGLKYWAGAPEDHLGVPMYGIEGRYRVDQPQTYGRARLSQLLAEAGFARSDFLSPLPDYKLPVSVVTPAGMVCAEFDASALAAQSAHRDPQLPQSVSFALELAWPSVMQNGLGADLANSFLIAASVSNVAVLDATVLAYHYSTERMRDFCKQTVFRQEESGAIRVHCSLLAPASTAAQGQILTLQVPEETPYVQGHTLASELVELVTRDGWSIDAVGAFLKRYLEIVGPLAFDGEAMPVLTSVHAQLPGVCFDLVPQNIIRDPQGGHHAIDSEWTLVQGMPVGWLLFRTLLLLAQGVTRFGAPSSTFVTTRRGFFLAAFRSAGFDVNAKVLESFATMEASAQAEATGQPAASRMNWWADAPLPMQARGERTAQDVRELEVQLQQSTELIAAQQNQLQQSNELIEMQKNQLQQSNELIESHRIQLQQSNELVESHRIRLQHSDELVTTQRHQLQHSNELIATQLNQLQQSNELIAMQQQQLPQIELVAALQAKLAEQQNQLEQLGQTASAETAVRDHHIVALQGALQDIRASRSWRVTRPLRAVSTAAMMLRSKTRSLPSVIKVGGGVIPTMRTTIRVLRSEGLNGVRARLANVPARLMRIDPVDEVVVARAATLLQGAPYYPNPLWDAEPPLALEGRDSFAVHCHLGRPEDADACLQSLSAIPIPFDVYVSVAGGNDKGGLQRAWKRGLPRVGLVRVEDVPASARPLTAMLALFGKALTAYSAFVHFDFSGTDGLRAAQSLTGPCGSSGGRLPRLLGLLDSSVTLVLASDSQDVAYRHARQADAGWVARIARACGLQLDPALANWPVVGTSAFLLHGNCLKEALPVASLLNEDGGGLAREALLSDALAALLPVFASSHEGGVLQIQQGDSTDDFREYEGQRDYSDTIVHRDVKILSYYLPQFHPTPENDEWHGEGFTEWTKVRAANPLFEGHYQQHIPHPDIGYYLLGSPDTLRQQAEQMRQAGVHGQVFYHYWFSGRMILEKPAQMLLEHADIAMPFCFCWANENWTRRWDGNEREILLGQTYSADDARAFIRYLIPFFRDPRYIRVGMRPMLMVYRPSSMPNPAEYLQIWAEECAQAGIDAPYMVAVLTRGATNPADFQMDAGLERPLHDWTDGVVPDLRPSLQAYWPMNGSVLSYDQVRDFYMAQNDRKSFDYFRSNVPMWDNTARYGTEALMLHGSTPRSFQQWMEHSIADAQANLELDRRFVVVNAWNEWAEGTHLEPDTRYGYSYLNSIGRALSALPYAHELNSTAPLPEGLRLQVHFSPELVKQLNADALTRDRFFHCLAQCRILKEAAVCVDYFDYPDALPLARAEAAGMPGDLHIEFQRPVHFAPDVVEHMVQMAIATHAIVVCNDYGTRLSAQSMTANGAIHAKDAKYASLLVRPAVAHDTLARECRMRSDAWCFELHPNSVEHQESLPRVTTILRFHKRARLDELQRAISCLYVMQDCIVVPLIAAQDLDAAQTVALTQMLQTFDWRPGCEPIVDHYASPNGQGDLRSKMLNESLRKVATKYAAFLDYDDLLFPDAYAWLIQRLQETGKAVAFGRVYWTDCRSQLHALSQRRKAFEYGGSHREFVQQNHAPLHSILLNVERLDLSELVYFDDQRFMEDYLMTLQLFTQDNADWHGLGQNFYLGDYVHSTDRQHTLALNDDAVREALLRDPEYMACERRIAEMRIRPAKLPIE